MEAEQQMDIFSWEEVGSAQPEKPKEEPKKTKVQPKDTKAKPKKLTLKLIEGEVAYQCLECDEKPTIYDRLMPMATCPECGVLLEVIDEKIPQIEAEEKKSWV